MLEQTIFLATLNKVLVDGLSQPLRVKFPSKDFWWLFYVALLTGGVIGWFSTLNLFTGYIPEDVIGRILTAVLIGGGSSLIHRVFESSLKVIKGLAFKNGVIS